MFPEQVIVRGSLSQTLKNRIAGKAFTMEELLELAIQIADALDAAHQKGITAPCSASTLHPTEGRRVWIVKQLLQNALVRDRLANHGKGYYPFATS